MNIKQELVYREILGEHILIPVSGASDKNGLFVMTELGAFIWNLIKDEKNQDEILKCILDEYDVEEETAKNDLEEFLVSLRDYGIID